MGKLMDKKKDPIESLQDSYTPEEAADILRIDIQTLYRWLDLKLIPHFKLSRNKTFISKSDLNNFIKSKKIET